MKPVSSSAEICAVTARVTMACVRRPVAAAERMNSAPKGSTSAAAHVSITKRRITTVVRAAMSVNPTKRVQRANVRRMRVLPGWKSVTAHASIKRSMPRTAVRVGTCAAGMRIVPMAGASVRTATATATMI